MMLYIQFAKSKQRYERARARLEDLLREKEQIFDQTQPRSVPFDKDCVQGGGGVNPMDAYLIALETSRIDERIKIAKDIVTERRALLADEEIELRQSTAVLDRVYCFKYLDNRRIGEIMAAMNYSESQLYRYFRAIDETLTEDESE